MTGKISLEEIMDKIGAGEKEYPYKDVSKEANHLWYIYSESFVTWLINTYGMEKVMDLYNNGQSEEDYEKLETGGYFSGAGSHCTADKGNQTALTAKLFKPSKIKFKIKTECDKSGSCANLLSHSVLYSFIKFYMKSF